MRKPFVFSILLVLTALVSSAVTWQTVVSKTKDKSVYLIGAVTITDPKRLPEYRAIAEPLAASSGGYVPLAFSEPTMIEGKKPTGGLYFIERYDSLEGLQKFLNSEGFKKAKVLRDQVADVHFMMHMKAGH